MELDKKALNKELLLWAGFTCNNGVWSYPDGIVVDDGAPFFPESLDACFKWLVPKMEECHISIGTTDGFSVTVYCVHNGHTEDYTAYADNPALALFSAIYGVIK